MRGGRTGTELGEGGGARSKMTGGGGGNAKIRGNPRVPSTGRAKWARWAAHAWRPSWARRGKGRTVWARLGPLGISPLFFLKRFLLFYLQTHFVN
jgi:hypothetical protein